MLEVEGAIFNEVEIEPFTIADIPAEVAVIFETQLPNVPPVVIFDLITSLLAGV